jgi:hypothetical protein
MKFLKDALGDKSSGILMMVVMFVAAVAIANIGVCMGADLGQLALLVAAFLVPVAGGQIGQALQGLPNSQPPAAEGSAPGASQSDQGSLGFVQNPLGNMDIGRILKLTAVLIAMELAIRVMAIRKDAGLVGMAQICGAFLAYATASEISQKAGGV